MDSRTTLLITAPPPALLAAVRDRRPDWQVLELVDATPSEADLGDVWGFIDWICPRMSGLELCRRLRESAPMRRAHLTMVLESDRLDDRRRALQAGADDYVLGPLDAARIFERMEMARPLPALPATRQVLRHGDLSLDLAAHQVRFGGNVVAMRANEFRLLAHFIEYPDQVFARGSLIHQLGKDALKIDERTVDVWIGRLRRSLAAAGVPDPVRTVRSLGYVLDSLD